MPSVMIYVRQQDYEKWLAIGNRPEWLHEHLNYEPVTDDPTPQTMNFTSDKLTSV